MSCQLLGALLYAFAVLALCFLYAGTEQPQAMNYAATQRGMNHVRSKAKRNGETIWRRARAVTRAADVASR
jgi:hypothetical protein